MIRTLAAAAAAVFVSISSASLNYLHAEELDRYQQQQLARAKFFCTWVTTHAYRDKSIVTPAYCADASVAPAAAIDQCDKWWRQVRDLEDDDKYESSFDVAWRTAAAQTPQHSGGDEKYLKELAAKAGSMSIKDLCLEYFSSGTDVFEKELKRRHAFNAAEWRLIESHKIALGLSEDAVRCTFGEPKEVRRVMKDGYEQDQYVYDGIQIFVAKEKVNAIQN
jgi:hypothetical protein